MKKISNASFPIAVFFAGLLLLGCKRKQQQAETATRAAEYSCPMHPQILKNAPGSCPICKMDLVLQHSHHEYGAANDSLTNLVIPTDEVVLSGIKTIKPERGSRFEKITAKGIINYNSNNQNSISSRVTGRIERLFVKYNYQRVAKGQKLMEIYSPDLANAQQELLFLKNAGETRLLESAKRKLRLLGSTEQQINQVLKSGRVDYTVSIYSPYSGYVSESQTSTSPVSATASLGSTNISGSDGERSSSMNEMIGSQSRSSMPPAAARLASNSPTLLREGQYISVGQRLFGIVNADAVWAEFYVNTSNLDLFKRGSSVQIESVDVKSKKAHVPVGLVQPYFSQGMTYSLVRATLFNKYSLWKVGELITVTTESTRKMGYRLPRTAVLQLGSRYVAFVKNNGIFKPVYVQVRSVGGEWIDIGDSLGENQEVASNAWFLVDSESFIKVQNPV